MSPLCDVPVRSVMPPPQVAHTARPVSKMGPVITRDGVTRGLRALSEACTRSNVSCAMMAGASL
jgi:hypothetical protein